MPSDLNGSTAPQSEMVARIEAIARQAGEIALSHFRSAASSPVEEKGHLDLVTRADREVEAFLVERLREAFPEDGVYGEEGGDVSGTSGRTWIIDPIDGTFNFVRGGQNWAVSIGLFETRRPVFGVIFSPARDLMLAGGVEIPARLNGKAMPALPNFNLSQGSTGIGVHPSIATEDRLELIRFISDELRITFRCNGSSAVSIVEVAMGETDGYVALGDSTWDVMAGLPILASLGGSDTIDWDRTALQDKLRFACGTEAFLSKVEPLLQSVAQTATTIMTGQDAHGSS
ncbi:inositol monophosphatase family protein [Notoacmeibacter sp. MSK16QG-6]|uniref:inositol monophosphatase family protein n=1 Tax=Notoacmeibacter sp. MSK16QG-6 TaxID=2957982 RepID=UPI00209DFA37|nr:inositol monophosphatase family protein [Notoacmeibacter sp. MSK16QG-6]MCP1200972.1 inositol monophosphatase [Notoacmeibacter sp. MSK16QG-6]